MAAIKATRAPAGSVKSAAWAAVGTSRLPIWPGITTGLDARCQCTWAMHQGCYQVKYAHRMCPVPSHRRHSRA